MMCFVILPVEGGIGIEKCNIFQSLVDSFGGEELNLKTKQGKEF